MGKKEIVHQQGECQLLHIENQSKAISKNPKFINTKLGSQQREVFNKMKMESLLYLQMNQEELLVQKYSNVRKYIENYVRQNKPKNSIMLYRLQNIEERISLWKNLLPRVEIFYSVKSNSDEQIIKRCIKCGTGFGASSVGEIKLCFDLGVQAENMIFANPIKTPNQLQYARNNDVRLLSFDNKEELMKIKESHPNAECILRISTNTEKFGVDPEEAEDLLITAQQLNLRIKGVSFNYSEEDVPNFEDYVEALKNARAVFDLQEKLGIPKLTLLNIGGGFSMSNSEENDNFVDLASKLSKQIDQLFPDRSVRVIAEPGAYLVESCCYLASKIIGQKNVKETCHYYINNGIYQGYMNRILNQKFTIEPLIQKEQIFRDQRDKLKSVFWGQTCDSCDYIIKGVAFPIMKTGEWVISQNHGAYHNEMSNNFNGFDLPQKLYIHDL